jgi:hypothetical protein
MIRTGGSFLIIAFLLMLLVFWTGDSSCYARQIGSQGQMKAPQEEKEPDKIVAAPTDVKERTGIWAFFIWMWVSIFVLIFFLRLKIKEVDRLHRLRFFSVEKK